MASPPSNEEKLRMGVLSGSVDNYVDLLKTLSNVDIKDSSGQTLLQLAVSLGKQKWVERLLGFGADPLAEDSRGVSVLEVAKGMWAKYPKGNARNAILKLLLVVIQRDKERLDPSATSRRSVTVQASGDTQNEPRPGSSTKARSSVSVQASGDTLSESVPGSSTEARRSVSVQASGDTLSESVPGSSTEARRSVSVQASGDTQSKRRPGSSTEARSSVSVQASLDVQNEPNLSGGQVSLLMEEIRSLRTAHLEEFESIRGEMAKLRDDLSSRDLILEKLESSVTELAEGKSSGKLKEKGVATLAMKESTDRRSVAKSIDQRVRDDCIDAMMKMTQVLNENEVKTSRTRQFYEKMYDGGKFTSAILKFLRRQDRVKVLIDFDSDNVEMLKSQFRDHERERRNGCDFRSFANFRDLQVYFGAAPEYYPMQVPFFKEEKDITHHLAIPLAQLSMYLFFKNDGRPYSDEDGISEELFGKCIQDAVEVSKCKTSQLSEWISRGFNEKSRLGKEIELIAVPVGISACFGQTTAANTLCRNLPSVLAFYENFVHHKLEDKLNSDKDVV